MAETNLEAWWNDLKGMQAKDLLCLVYCVIVVWMSVCHPNCDSPVDKSQDCDF